MEQEQNKNWLEQEQATLPTPTEFVKLPPVKFEENTVKSIVIDFSQPFKKWKDETTGKTKAIIPCKEVDLTTKASVEKIWWLNTLNPYIQGFNCVWEGRAKPVQYPSNRHTSKNKVYIG